MLRAFVMVVILIGGRAAQAGGPPEQAAIAAVIDDQFAGFRDSEHGKAIYAKGAMVAMTGGTSSPQVNKLGHADGKWTIFGPATVGKHKVRDLRVTVARDGKAAWASFVAKVSLDGLTAKAGSFDFRATELFVAGTGGWQVMAAAWSVGVANATVAKAAGKGGFKTLETVFDQNLGERDVIAAMQALPTGGLDATAGARTDLISVGTAPGDTVVGGKKVGGRLAKDWTKLAIDGSVWAVTAGSTACATANIEVERGGHTVPGRLFAVFEKNAEGAWSPVLLHLAAAPPS